MEQKELHTITGSLNRREMEQKMCNPNILGSCIKFYQPPNFSDPFLPFLLFLCHRPPLSVSSHGFSYGQGPKSQWVLHVPFQSLAVVIFQLAWCSRSCQSVTNDWSILYCTCAAAIVRDWELSIRQEWATFLWLRLMGSNLQMYYFALS